MRAGGFPNKKGRGSFRRLFQVGKICTVSNPKAVWQVEIGLPILSFGVDVFVFFLRMQMICSFVEQLV